jgi:hypothetical protein
MRWTNQHMPGSTLCDNNCAQFCGLISTIPIPARKKLPPAPIAGGKKFPLYFSHSHAKPRKPLAQATLRAHPLLVFFASCPNTFGARAD